MGRRGGGDGVERRGEGWGEGMEWREGGREGDKGGGMGGGDGVETRGEGMGWGWGEGMEWREEGREGDKGGGMGMEKEGGVGMG